VIPAINMYQNFASSGGGYGDSSSFPYGSNAAGYNAPSSASSQASPSHHASSHMNESAAVALLQHLGKDDLQNLLDDDAKLQGLINDLTQIKTLQQEHDQMVATNKSLAEYNLSLQPRIEGLIQQVGCEYATVNTLKTDLAQDKTRLDQYVGHQSLDTLHALLQTEVAKSEEESENLAEQFCSQEIESEQFLTCYLPQRTVAHLRRIKSERLADLIREGGTAGGQWGVPGPAVASRPPYPAPTSSPAPPYPTSNYGMPQPNPNMYTHR